ncbi:MAG TPA: alpha/beta hydrolase [Chryseolinea sp.]|nr:alpha/beta hydrolase [Chryseolinea sp.]
MKPYAITTALLLMAAFVTAQQKVIPLYNGPAPGSENWTWSEATMTDKAVVYNVSKPTLTVFAPEAGKANGSAIVICPGGGFQFLAINKEGYDVAKWLAKKGVTCFVLKYRLVHSNTTDPISEFNGKVGKKEFQEENVATIPLSVADGRAAIAYVRAHASEFKVDADRIGIMGFSAGGTVTSSTLFEYTPENRPNFAAPIYPFFPKTMIGTVATDAPPIFIVAATDDGFSLAPHSVELYSQWISTKHDAELHMYARGGHGFGMDSQHLPTDTWIERFAEWMDVQGFLKKKL